MNISVTISGDSGSYIFQIDGTEVEALFMAREANAAVHDALNFLLDDRPTKSSARELLAAAERVLEFAKGQPSFGIYEFFGDWVPGVIPPGWTTQAKLVAGDEAWIFKGGVNQCERQRFRIERNNTSLELGRDDLRHLTELRVDDQRVVKIRKRTRVFKVPLTLEQVIGFLRTMPPDGMFQVQSG